MEPDPRTNWGRSRIFRWMIGIGPLKATVVATAAIDLLSLLFAVATMAALNRLSWMGVFISGTLPVLLVPLQWYPFMRISVQLDAAETRLRTSEGRYRSILEKMSEAYVEIDQHGRLTFFNDSLCRITGYERAQLELRGIAEFLTPSALRRLLRSALRFKGSERAGAVYDLPITARDRTPRYLDVSFSLLRDQHNRWFGYRAVLFDVSEKTAAEQERREFERRLTRARRMESLGILAGGVAHDLNNILCGIVGYPDLLLLDYREDGYLKSSLQAMKQSGEKAAAVVQDLLALSRRGLTETDVLNLNTIVGNYLSSPEYAHLAGNFPEIRLTTDLEPGLLNIEGSGFHLYKAVMNLVLNSYEAIAPPGSVRLTTANRFLDRPVKGYDHVRPGEYVTLTVADSGVGILPEDTDRIFEPFYTRKALGRSGSGLGLAVVWAAVKDHQGYIIVAGELGQGTSIELFFPASRRELVARPPAPEIASCLGRGERVLVVDDMPEQRKLISGILERLGYRARAVSSGEEAVDLLKVDAVDLVILDMIMDPGMDGLDTYRKLHELRPELRVIITSGYSETDRVREALRLGAGPYVKKPFGLVSLAAVIREALDA